MADTCMRYLLLDGLEIGEDDFEFDFEHSDAASELCAGDFTAASAFDMPEEFRTADLGSMNFEISNAAGPFEADDAAGDFGTLAGEFTADAASDWSEELRMADDLNQAMQRAPSKPTMQQATLELLLGLSRQIRHLISQIWEASISHHVMQQAALKISLMILDLIQQIIG
jgi:hypothetical protein